MLFLPNKRTGLLVGLAALIALGGLDAALLLSVRAVPSAWTMLAGLLLLASLPIALWLSYGVYGLWHARYIVGRNALVVDWGWRREVIPMARLGAVRVGEAELKAVRAPRWRWPGYVAGEQAQLEDRPIEFWATSAEPAQWVMLGYPGGWLVLSPPDPQTFIEALSFMRAEGAEETIEPESRRSGWLDWPLWSDRVALTLLALTSLSLLALLIYLTALFPTLPPTIALHFDGQGLPNRFGPPEGLFLLPIIGGIVWAVNTVGGLWLHQRAEERTGAYLLLGAALLTQALLWMATLGLLLAGS